MSLSANFSERLRLLRIYQVIFAHTMEAVFGGTGTMASLRRRMQHWLWRPPVQLRHLPPPVQFRILLEELGPTYVKVGQLISSQARSLPTEWETELARLQSDVPSFPGAEAMAIVEEELGAPPDVLYESFDPEPLAAASLAQVHRATLHDGRRVAVKVQRPAIHRQLRSDVRILARTSRALETRARWAADVDLAGVVREFGTTLLRELDYNTEAYNARRLSEVVAPIDGVHICEIDYDLSSSRVLTMEFIEGVKPSETAAIDAAGLDREHLARQMVRAAVKMLIVDGFFHADPHPGNVKVELDSGRLTLLDTGMVGEFSLRQRFNLANLIFVTQKRDVTGLAQTMRSLSTPFRDTVDDRAFDRDFERKMTPFVNPPPGRKADVANKVIPMGMDLLGDHGYRLDSQLTLGMKSLVQAQAITQHLVPQWTGTEFADTAIEAVQELVPEALTPEVLTDAAVRQAGFVAREVAQRMPSLQDGALKWLDQVQRGKITVALDTSSLDDQVSAIRRITRVVTAGIVIVGLIIGSAIAASVGTQENSDLGSIVDFALILFAGASIAGVIAVLVLVYHVIWPHGRQKPRDPLTDA